MSHLIFLTIFFIVGILNLALGLLASKNVKTTKDFLVAGRSLGLIPVTLTLLATQIGGGMLLITDQEAYKIGYFETLYSLGVVLGLLILGLGIASKLRSLNITTTSEIFELKYNCPTLNKIASIFSIVSLFGILVGQIIASRLVLSHLGIENEFLTIIFWLFIMIYTTTGGLKAVAFTDSFQVIFIFLVLGSIFLYTFYFETDTIFSISAIIKHQKLFPNIKINHSDILSIILMPALFSLIGQDVAQRFFASKTKRIATISALLSCMLLIIFSFIPLYFGIKAKLLGLELTKNPFLAVISKLTNETIGVLAAYGIMAAITSTGDSLLVAIISNMFQFFKNGVLGVKNKLASIRIMTLITGTLALIFSYFIPTNLIRIIIGSYELSVSCLLVPTLFGYFKKNLNKKAAMTSILFGLVGFILFRIYPTQLPRGITATFLSLMGYFIGNKIK